MRNRFAGNEIYSRFVATVIMKIRIVIFISALLAVSTACQKTEFEEILTKTKSDNSTVGRSGESDNVSGANSIELNDEDTTTIRTIDPQININIKEVSDGDDESDGGDDSRRTK